MHRHFCLKRQESDEVKTLLYLCIVERKETLFFREKRKKSARFPNNKKTFCIFATETKTNSKTLLTKFFKNFPAGGYTTGATEMENSSKIKFEKMGSFNGNYAKYKRTLFVSDELAQAKNCRGAFGYVTYGNTIEQTSMGSYLESFGGVEKLYEKIGNKWVEITPDVKDEVAEAIDAFILNNYGFLKGTDEYDFILYQILGIMTSYGFIDKDGDFIQPGSIINFLGYDQFKSELKTGLARYMDWIVEMGGEKLDLFVNCE